MAPPARRDPAPTPAAAPSGEVAGAPPPPWFRLVVWQSLLGAACPLLPLPFVDDLIEARLRGWMVRDLCRAAPLDLAPHQPRLLARRGAAGCRRLPAMLWWIVVYPLRKVFRKVVYLLAVKDATDAFSQLLHEGYLLHRALAATDLPRQPSDAQLVALRGAVAAALARVDPRPLRRLVGAFLRGSWAAVGGLARWLGSLLRRGRREGLQQAAEAPPSGEVAGLADRAAALLWGERGWAGQLDAALAASLAEHGLAPRRSAVDR